MPDLSRLEALIGRLVNTDFSQSTELATREIAVNPLIGALGWDTFNPEEVAREHSVLGGRADYCLRAQARNLVLVEVKRTGTPLDEYQEQLLRYAFSEGVALAALTDGLVWWLYLPMAGVSWERRLFLRVNFCDQNISAAAEAIHRFLNRDGVIAGEAEEEAKRELERREQDRRVDAALKVAWQKALGDPDGVIRNLLSEDVGEITGDSPDQEVVMKFLKEMLERSSEKGERRILQAERKSSRKGSRNRSYQAKRNGDRTFGISPSVEIRHPSRLAEMPSLLPDWQAVLAIFMSKKVDFHESGKQMAVERLVHMAAGFAASVDEEERAAASLARCGLRLTSGMVGETPERWLCVANRHPGLHQLLAGETWNGTFGGASTWKNAVKGIPGAVPGATMKFAGIASRCMKIPLQLLLKDTMERGASSS